MKNIIIFSPKNSGQNIQSVLISDKLCLDYISLEDLLNHEIEKDTYIGRMYTNLTNRGVQMPDDVIFSLIKSEILNSKNQNGFVFDSYPNTIQQCKFLDEFMFSKKMPIKNVFEIVVSDSILLGKINNETKNKTELMLQIQAEKNSLKPFVEYYDQRTGVQKINGDTTNEEILNEILDKIK